MTLPGAHRKLSRIEFAAMMAYMMSIVALSLDAMLPVLDTIGNDLGVTDPNRTQWIVGLFYFGFALGQLIYGPVSDSLGRRYTILAGILLFVVGCFISIFATSFYMHLFGRLLQGLGAAAPRIISMAVVRDVYEGRAMAQVGSIIMGFFILVPALAPALGQWIANVANWQAIYIVLLGMAVANYIWYAVRLGETLHPEYRRPLNIRSILSGYWEVANTRVALGYTVGAGIVSGGFLAYLMTSPQLFADLFGITDKFPYYFGGLALAIGGASVVNSTLVMRLGMRRLTLIALCTQVVVSTGFLILTFAQGGELSLIQFLVWAVITFFMMGVMFGNINAIAMEPLGHIAGIGSAFVGAVSALIALSCGALVSQNFNGTVIPIILGFAGYGIIAILVMQWADRGEH